MHLRRSTGLPDSSHDTSARSAFTLIELIVTIAIIGVLVSLLIPSIRGATEAARSNECRMNLRVIASDFMLFADDMLNAGRGNDPDVLGSDNRFLFSTFIESEYSMDEFWPDDAQGVFRELPRSGQHQYLQCPSARHATPLRIFKAKPCYLDGFDPATSISYGFNFRLYRRDASLFGAAGIPILNMRLLSEPNVPLVWDVHWEAEQLTGIRDGVFSAPGLGSTGPYLSNDQRWNPARRHNGSMNVGFIDGHVESTSAPLSEPNWRWDFVPR